MARFAAGEVDNYGGQGSGGFFGLADDGDVARVRFCYSSIDDVEGYSCHQVVVGQNDQGKDIKRWVNCLREYNQPIDDCPFCREKMPTYAKLFVPVYDMDNQVIKTWERGKKFFGKLTHLISRYPNTVTRVFEIERCGKKGDTNTSYEIYPIDDDLDEDLTVEDLGELPQVIGGIVLDKTAEDMEYFLEQGEFPPTDDDEEQEEERPAKRPSRNTSSNRRTPSGRGSRRGESF